MQDQIEKHKDTHLFGTAALVGPPNAGKSTLMNTMVGEKVAIVTPRAQTTRNRISGILSTDRYQVVFLDTPGVNKARGKLGELLNRSAMEGLNSADVVLLVVDTELYVRKPHFLKKDFQPFKKRVSGLSGVIVVSNKTDKVRDKKKMLPVWQELSRMFPEREILPVSASTGEGTELLLERILEHLHPGPALYPEDQLSTLPMRFMVAEIIREKLFLSMRQEVPYGLAVEIEYWREQEDLLHISAVIYVLRDAHKSMVIGRGGEVLKKVGMQARLEAEALSGKRVYLETHVKVRPGWDENPGFLRSLGI